MKQQAYLSRISIIFYILCLLHTQTISSTSLSTLPKNDPNPAEALSTQLFLNQQDNNGRTVAHLAVALGKHDTFRSLIQHNADITLADDQGQTPLHFACTTHTLPHILSILQRYPKQVGKNLEQLYNRALLHNLPKKKNRLALLAYTLLRNNKADYYEDTFLTKIIAHSEKSYPTLSTLLNVLLTYKQTGLHRFTGFPDLPTLHGSLFFSRLRWECTDYKPFHNIFTHLAKYHAYPQTPLLCCAPGQLAFVLNISPAKLTALLNLPACYPINAKKAAPALHYAAATGDIPLCIHLLQIGADKNNNTPDGLPALFYTTFNNNFFTCVSLIIKGCAVSRIPLEKLLSSTANNTVQLLAALHPETTDELRKSIFANMLIEDQYAVLAVLPTQPLAIQNWYLTHFPNAIRIITTYNKLCANMIDKKDLQAFMRRYNHKKTSSFNKEAYNLVELYNTVLHRIGRDAADSSITRGVMQNFLQQSQSPTDIDSETTTQ